MVKIIIIITIIGVKLILSIIVIATCNESSNHNNNNHHDNKNSNDHTMNNDKYKRKHLRLARKAAHSESDMLASMEACKKKFAENLKTKGP